MPKTYLSKKQKKIQRYEKFNRKSVTDDPYAPWSDLVDQEWAPLKTKTNLLQEFAKLPYSRGSDRGSKKRASVALPTSPSLKEMKPNIVPPTAANKPDAIHTHVPTPSTVSVTPLRLVKHANSQADITPHRPITPPVPSPVSPSSFPSIPSHQKRKYIIESSDGDTDEKIKEFQTPPTKQRRYTHEKQGSLAHVNQRDKPNRRSRAIAVTPVSPQVGGPATWPSNKAAVTAPLTSLHNPPTTKCVTENPAGTVLSVFDFLSVVNKKEKPAKKGGKKPKYSSKAARSGSKRTSDYGKWLGKLDISDGSDDDKIGDESMVNQGRQEYANPPTDVDVIKAREPKDTLTRVECGKQKTTSNISKQFPERKSRGTVCYLELESEDEELIEAHYDDVELRNVRQKPDEPVPTKVGLRANEKSVANATTTLSVPKSRTSRTKPSLTIKRPNNSSSAGQNNHARSMSTRSMSKRADKDSDSTLEKPSLSFSDAPLTVTQTDPTPSPVLDSPLPRTPLDSTTSFDPIVMSQDQPACAYLNIKSRTTFPKFTLSEIGKSFVLIGAKPAEKKCAKDHVEVGPETGGELRRVAEVDKNIFENDGNKRRQAKRTWMQWQWEEPPAKFARHRGHETVAGTPEAEHGERGRCDDDQANIFVHDDKLEKTVMAEMPLNERRIQVNGTTDDRGNDSKKKGSTNEGDEQIQEFNVRKDPGEPAPKRHAKCNKWYIRPTHHQNNNNAKPTTPYDVEKSPPPSHLHLQSSAVSLRSLDVVKYGTEEVNSRKRNAEESAWRCDANRAFSAEESTSQERAVEKASSLCYDMHKITSDEESDIEALRSTEAANEAFGVEKGNVEKGDTEVPSDDETGGDMYEPFSESTLAQCIPNTPESTLDGHNMQAHNFNPQATFLSAGHEGNEATPLLRFSGPRPTKGPIQSNNFRNSLHPLPNTNAAVQPLACLLADNRALSSKILPISSDRLPSSVESPPKEAMTHSQSSCFVSQTFDFPPPPSFRNPTLSQELDTTNPPTIPSLATSTAPKTVVPKVGRPSSQAIRKRMLLVPLREKVAPAARAVATARVTHGLGDGGKNPSKKRTMSNLVELGFVTIDEGKNRGLSRGLEVGR